MKILNRSTSNKKIQWLASENTDDHVIKTVKRFREVVLQKGTKSFKEINDELELRSPRSYKVKASEILNSELLVSDKLKKLNQKVFK